jgi:hypothetical protein
MLVVLRVKKELLYFYGGVSILRPVGMILS